MERLEKYLVPFLISVVLCWAAQAYLRRLGLSRDDAIRGAMVVGALGVVHGWIWFGILNGPDR